MVRGLAAATGRRAGPVRSAPFIAILIGCVMAFGACSDREDAPMPTSEPPPTLPTPAQTLAPAPAAAPTGAPPPTAKPVPTRSVPTPVADGTHGGTLRLATSNGVRHHDVHQDASPALSTWGPGLAYSRLLRLRSGPDVELPSMAVECELCHAWEMTDDRTFVFHLRDEARWHDIAPVNGRGLVAEDLVYSYTRQRTPDFPNAALLQGIDEMEATGPARLTVSMTLPDADFMLALADGRSKIVAIEAVALNGDLTKGPTVGTGPWILRSSGEDSAHTFDRNPGYFEHGLPFVDRLIVQVVPDRTALDAAFTVGALDVHLLSPRLWESLRETRPDMSFLTVPTPGGGLEVGLSTVRPPFDDARLRRAARLAMDPWSAIDEVWYGAASVGMGLPAAAPGWLLDHSTVTALFARPDDARELLAEASPGAPVPVTIKVGGFGDPYLAHAGRIADEMAAVGFEPTLERVDRVSYADDVWTGGGYQMFIGPPAHLATPNQYLLGVLHSQGRLNTTGHADDELDMLILAQAAEMDPVERQRLVREIQIRALEGAYRFMPAVHNLVLASWPRVKNLYPNFALFEYAHWSRVWIEQ